MTKRHIHLMAEYDAFPLWERTPGAEPGDIDPSHLSLTRELREGLLAWAAAYDASDPLSAWPRSVERRWRREGRALARALRRELGSSTRITVQF